MGQGYLIVALVGLVIAGLLAALAAYLSALLISVLLDIARSPSYSGGRLFFVAPAYLAAAVLPFWGVRIFWLVLSGPERGEDRTRLRRSGCRLVTWTLSVYGVLSALILALSLPTPDRSIFGGLAGMAALGFVALAPLLMLLVGNSPIGPADGPPDPKQ